MAETAEDVKNPVETETTLTESSTEETNSDGVIVLGDEDLSEAKPEEETEVKTTESGNTDEEIDSTPQEAKAEETSPKKGNCK